MTPKPAAHTPTPWIVDGNAIRDEAKFCLALVEKNNRSANAAYIVKCVNAHEELLAACKEALDWMLPEFRDADVTYKLEIAIAKAEGK